MTYPSRVLNLDIKQSFVAPESYIYLSIYLSIYLYIYLSIHLYIYIYIIDQLAWSIRDLLYGIKGTEKMIFVIVYFRALKRKPVICKSDNAFRFSRFLVPSRPRNHRKSFTVTENILRKKTFVHPRGLQRNVVAGTKRVIPSGQYRSILPSRVANHSAVFGSSCPLAQLAI